MGSTDLIPGTNVDEILLAVVGVLVALTTLAALSHKPPLLQVGRFLGWIFGRIIGEPIAGYLAKRADSIVRPLIRAELVSVKADLAHVHDCVERMGNAATEKATEAADAAAEAVTAAEATKAWREGPLKEWQDGVDEALLNVQAAQVVPKTVE